MQEAWAGQQEGLGERRVSGCLSSPSPQIAPGRHVPGQAQVQEASALGTSQGRRRGRCRVQGRPCSAAAASSWGPEGRGALGAPWGHGQCWDRAGDPGCRVGGADLMPSLCRLLVGRGPCSGPSSPAEPAGLQKRAAAGGVHGPSRGCSRPIALAPQARRLAAAAMAEDGAGDDRSGPDRRAKSGRDPKPSPSAQLRPTPGHAPEQQATPQKSQPRPLEQPITAPK